jgi:hypothetical protein
MLDTVRVLGGPRDEISQAGLITNEIRFGMERKDILIKLYILCPQRLNKLCLKYPGYSS